MILLFTVPLKLFLLPRTKELVVLEDVLFWPIITSCDAAPADVSLEIPINTLSDNWLTIELPKPITTALLLSAKSILFPTNNPLFTPIGLLLFPIETMLDPLTLEFPPYNRLLLPVISIYDPIIELSEPNTLFLFPKKRLLFPVLLTSEPNPIPDTPLILALLNSPKILLVLRYKTI